MALPGLLIEYLVSGAVALAWLFPLLAEKLPKAEPAYLPVVFLLLYVLGMAVDFIAFALTRLPKRWLRTWVLRKYRGTGARDTGSGTARQAKILLYAPDLARELSMRSSRDRITRGLVVNAILAAILVLPWQTGVPLFIFSAILWAGFERLSYAYELCAEQLVEEKLRRDGDKLQL